MVRELGNHPSIVQWCIFNELWGIYDVDRICGMVRALDTTRLIDAQSGGEDKGGYVDTGAGDVIDHHTYGPDPAWQVPEPGQSPNPFRIAVVGEYGGIETHVPGHMCCGVSLTRDPEPLQTLAVLYQGLQKKFIPRIPTGLSGMVYTQLYDTETEMNGLITYDRKVIKVDEELIRSVNEWIIGMGDMHNLGLVNN